MLSHIYFGSKETPRIIHMFKSDSGYPRSVWCRIVQIDLCKEKRQMLMDNTHGLLSESKWIRTQQKAV